MIFVVKMKIKYEKPKILGIFPSGYRKLSLGKIKLGDIKIDQCDVCDVCDVCDECDVCDVC